MDSDKFILPRNIHEEMKEWWVIYTAVIEKVKGEYVAQFPDLAGCIARGKTIRDVLAKAQDALNGYDDGQVGKVTLPERVKVKKRAFTAMFRKGDDVAKWLEADRIYTALIFTCADGQYWAKFPDLRGCLTQGVNVADIVYMCADAMEGYLACEEELPRARKPEDIKVPRPRLPRNLKGRQKVFLSFFPYKKGEAEESNDEIAEEETTDDYDDDFTLKTPLCREIFKVAFGRSYRAQLKKDFAGKKRKI